MIFYNIDYDIAGISICLILHVIMLRLYGDNKTIRGYRGMLLWNLIAASMDVVTAVTISYGTVIPTYVNVVLNTLYFAVAFQPGYAYCRYINAIAENAGRRVRGTRINHAVMAAYIALLIVNVFYPMIFGVDPTGVYYHGPLFLLVYAVPIYYMLVGLVVIIINRGILKVSQRVSLYLFVCLTTAGLVVQFFWLPNVLLTYFFPSIAYLLMLFSIETPDFNKLTHTLRDLEEANWRAEMAKEAAEQAKDVAEQATRAKSEFLASMSHEIRTPINAILGFDEMILRESNEQGIRQYATDIRGAGRTLLGIINDILDFSRVESGKMEILPREYKLHQMVTDVCNMILLKAKGKGIYFEKMIDTEIPDALYGDEKRLKQVLVNILTNAIKYTDIGGAQLHMEFEKISDNEIMLIVRVEDTGRGMRPEDIKKLFSPYERIDEADNAGVEGTGLGMTITKQLLEMMNSKLEVTSVFGEGSTFSFKVVQKVVDWEPVGNVDERARRTESEEFGSNQRFIAPDAHILVVDDTPINLKVFTALLKQTRICIDTAESGGEAFKKACKQHYDMIFLDHMMPDMDGIETLELIQSYDASLNIDTPSVMLTANALAGAREEYLSKGFSDYLSKPLDTKKLENILRKYLPADLIVPVDDKLTTKRANQERKKKHGRQADGEDMPELQTDVYELPAGDDADDEYDEGEYDDDEYDDDEYDDDEYDDDEYDEDYDDEDEDDEEAEAADELLSKLADIPDISTEAGIEASGGRVIYRQVVCDFAETGDSRAARIREFWEAKDYNNYMIQVHALKSTARLTGAGELSEHAKKLEQCARDEDVATIDAETEQLIDEYLTLAHELAKRIDKNDDKPVIDVVQLMDAIKGIIEAMEVFDTDTADMIMKQLEDYQMPESFGETYAKLKVLIAEVARDDVLELLKGVQL